MSALQLAIPDDAWDEVGDGRTTENEDDSFTCAECGKDMILNGNGTTNHLLDGSEGVDEIDYDADQDHAAFSPDQHYDRPERIEPWHKLNTAVTINGLGFHVDAWAIRPGSDPQEAFQANDDLAAIHDAVHADKPMDTMTIRGHEYVVVLTPYC